MTRNDRLIQEYNHDPYFLRTKLPDPSTCERCGVVFHNGVFDWTAPPPANAARITCPACRRIEDNFEGGIITLEGLFLESRKQEILNIIRNTENAQKARRPLDRIIKITDMQGKLEVTTTYEHLARRIGDAVNSAYKGNLELQYVEGKKYVRVFWRRD